MRALTTEEIELLCERAGVSLLGYTPEGLMAVRYTCCGETGALLRESLRYRATKGVKHCRSCAKALKAEKQRARAELTPRDDDDRVCFSRNPLTRLEIDRHLARVFGSRC